MIYRVTIPGEPVPKARPRLGRNGRTYTPAKTLAWERAAAWSIRQSIPESGLNESLELVVDVYCSRPKAHSKRRRLAREIKPTKPDADNYGKAVCDALEKSGVIVNDSRIWSLTVRKWWTGSQDEPRVEVVLTRSA